MASQVRRSTEISNKMLDEFRYADACLFLFRLNKADPVEWAETKAELLSTQQSPGRLSVLATILECSAKPDLSACNVLIPGLTCYTGLTRVPDLFE